VKKKSESPYYEKNLKEIVLAYIERLATKERALAKDKKL